MTAGKKQTNTYLATKPCVTERTNARRASEARRRQKRPCTLAALLSARSALRVWDLSECTGTEKLGERDWRGRTEGRRTGRRKRRALTNEVVTLQLSHPPAYKPVTAGPPHNASIVLLACHSPCPPAPPPNTHLLISNQAAKLEAPPPRGME